MVEENGIQETQYRDVELVTGIITTIPHPRHPNPDAEKIDKTAPPLSRHDSEMSVDSGYSSPQDPLLQATNSIKSQYFKTLYSTKTSLAYFAKSALSRARSEFSVMQPHAESLISSQ